MSTRSLKPLIFVVAAAALSLGGCTDLKRAVGLEKVIPDEFAVVKSAPLAIPPDFNLRPPRPGAPRPQEETSTQVAQKTVFRAGEQQAALPPPAKERSAGEDKLLQQAGAATAAPNIRDVVNREAEDTAPLDNGFVDKLLFWRSPDPKLGPTDNVINPQAEQERIRAAEAAGHPVAPDDQSATLTGPPTIERRRSSSLWNLF